MTHLVTFVDIDDAGDGGPNGRHLSVTARHEAALADGRRLLLLDDRGWAARQHTVFLDGRPSEEDRRRAELDSPGIWAHETVEGMQETARMVVGPDAAFGEHSEADMEADHWRWMASILHEHGVEVDAADLQLMRHDVELSDRVLARIGHGRSNPRDG